MAPGPRPFKGRCDRRCVTTFANGVLRLLPVRYLSLYLFFLMFSLLLTYISLLFISLYLLFLCFTSFYLNLFWKPGPRPPGKKNGPQIKTRPPPARTLAEFFWGAIFVSGAWGPGFLHKLATKKSILKSCQKVKQKKLYLCLNLAKLFWRKINAKLETVNGKPPRVLVYISQKLWNLKNIKLNTDEVYPPPRLRVVCDVLFSLRVGN